MFNIEIHGEVRRLEKKDFKRRNGENGVAYNLLFEGYGGTRVFPVTEHIYNDFELGKLKKGDEVVLLALYFPQYQFNQILVKDYRIVKE